MTRVSANAVWILVVMVVGVGLCLSVRVSVSILVGGLLALLNHHWMVAGVDLALGNPTSDKRRLVMLKYLLRILLILGFLFAMIHFSFFSLLGAIIGLSIFVLAGMLEALIHLIDQLKPDR